MVSLEYVDFWPKILLFKTQTACYTKSKYSLVVAYVEIVEDVEVEMEALQ